MQVAVGAIGAYVGYADVRVGVGIVVSPVVMEMIEAKKMMMADTADFMLYFTLSDNLMLLLEIVATSLINYSSPSCLSSVEVEMVYELENG